MSTATLDPCAIGRAHRSERRAPSMRRRRRDAAGGSARDVLAHIDAGAARVVELQARAEDVRAEAARQATAGGHELGDFYMGEGLFIAARCTGCTATVSLKYDGSRWSSLGEPCAHLQPRYFARKCGARWAVYDRERAAYGPVAGRWYRGQASAQKAAHALSTSGDAPPSAVDVARAAVERARVALTRAETRLHKLTGESPAKPRLALVAPSTTQEVREMPDETKKKTTRRAPAPKLDKATKRAAKRAEQTAKAPKLPSGPAMAEAVLVEHGAPMHGALICSRVLAIDAQRPPTQRAFRGATPAASIMAKLNVSAANGGVFVKVSPGCFGLRAWSAETLAVEPTRADTAAA